MSRSIFSGSQNEFIKDNYMDMTYVSMSKLEIFEGFTDKQIRNRARNLGLRKTRVFNDSYFETVDTPNKAYWIGFIYADGFISYNKESRNYEFGVEIHTKDEYLLDNLNRELGKVHKVSSRHREIEFNGYSYTSKCSRLRVYSKKMCDDLIAQGIGTHKTTSNIFPRIECDELFIHFIRGFFDGDGSVTVRNRKVVSISFTNSNEAFFVYMKNRLEDMGIKLSIYKEKEKKYKAFISRFDHMNFLNRIYKNSKDIRLKRKYELYSSCNGSPYQK